MEIEIPKILQNISVVSLDKGRVQTTLSMFMLNEEVFETLCLGYIRGEVTTVEARIGSTIKHPKDKYDRALGIKTATDNLKKQKLSIESISSRDGRSVINLKDYSLERLQSGKVIIKLRHY